eukprot:6491745-Amphidinium_carterae.2
MHTQVQHHSPFAACVLSVSADNDSICRLRALPSDKMSHSLDAIHNQTCQPFRQRSYSVTLHH